MRVSHPLILLATAAVLAAADVPAADPANQFGDPSFENGLGLGKSGKIEMYYEGAPLVDTSGTKAHSGKTAIGLPLTDAAGKPVFFQMAGSVTPGKTFQFKAFFKAGKEGGALHLQVNCNDSSKVFENNHLVGTKWEEKTLRVDVPADAKPDAILIIRGGTPENVVWMDDIYFGEAK